MQDVETRLRRTVRRVTGGVFAPLVHEFPVAARNLAALIHACTRAGGELLPIQRRGGAFLTQARAWSFRGRWQARWWESSLWVNPSFSSYKHAWTWAAEQGLVPYLDADERAGHDGWTAHGDFDLDHVFPESWALAAQPPFEWVRLFPVDRAVNQLTGSRWEGPAVREQRTRPRSARWPDIVYANELQIAKMMGHPTWDD